MNLAVCRLFLLLTAAGVVAGYCDDLMWEQAGRKYEENVRIAARYPVGVFKKAIQDGDVKTIKRLLDQGVPASCPLPWSKDSWEGYPPPTDYPIHLAASSGHIEIVRLLLDHGASPKARGGEGHFTPLHSTNDVEIAKLLIACGANVRAQDDDGWQPIHNATMPGYLENRRKESVAGSLALIKLLIAHGADPLARDKRQRQPIHVAAEYSSREVVSFLMDRHAKVNIAVHDKEDYSENGWQPLHFAAHREEDIDEALEVAKLLIRKGADVNAATAEGETPLHLARNAAMTRLLLDEGAKPNAMSTSMTKMRPIHYFAMYGDTESIRLLLDRGVDPNVLTGGLEPETPLEIAVFYSPRSDAANLLLKCGAKATKATLAAAECAKNPAVIGRIRARLDPRPMRPPHRR